MMLMVVVAILHEGPRPLDAFFLGSLPVGSQQGDGREPLVSEGQTEQPDPDPRILV